MNECMRITFTVGCGESYRVDAQGGGNAVEFALDLVVNSIVQLLCAHSAQETKT